MQEYCPEGFKGHPRYTFQQLEKMGILSAGIHEEDAQKREVAKAKMAAERAQGPAPKRSVSVFVRSRPLLGGEITGGVDPAAEDMARHFTGVLSSEADNEAVFETAFRAQLPAVLQGATASLFCYGYTGSGKTHTVIGYGSEPGLYRLAARELLKNLPQGLVLAVTASEVYNDEVFDLLGPTKLPCTLQTDDSGRLVVRGPAAQADLSQSQPGLVLNAENLEGSHATIVTRPVGLRRQVVREEKELDAIRETTVAARAVGASTEHEQSSRSHCLLRMQITTPAILRALDALEDARALIPALSNAMDNLGSRCAEQLVDMGSYNPSDHTMRLKRYEDPEEWANRKSSLNADSQRLRAAMEAAQASVAAAEADLAEMMRGADPAVGGTLLLADLAGADYDARDVGSGTTLEQRKESTSINKSLLALKECLRAIAGVPGAAKRPVFRNSKLTRLLEDTLSPAGGDAGGQNRDSHSVMLVNVCAACDKKKVTTNALRYAQLYAAGAR